MTSSVTFLGSSVGISVGFVTLLVISGLVSPARVSGLAVMVVCTSGLFCGRGYLSIAVGSGCLVLWDCLVLYVSLGGVSACL